MRNLMLVTFLSILCSQISGQDSLWQSLFNGYNLEGWHQVGGNAYYYAQDHALVGEAVMNTPNSFLVTDSVYTDFVLEFEVFVDSDLNSGVQVRSNMDSMRGNCFGYQVEIDPSKRAYSGGIYDEGRRGWLYPLSRNMAARKAFKTGKWNTFHIEAFGNTMNTWINGVHCASLVDDLTRKGFIGLQVHGIGDNRNLARSRIKWRKIRIRTVEMDSVRLTPGNEVPEISYLSNRLSDSEVQLGATLLWDGASAGEWRTASGGNVSSAGWSVFEGELKAGPGSFEAIMHSASFEDFELEMEFNIGDDASSGIMYLIDPATPQDSIVGYIFVLADDNALDAAEFPSVMELGALKEIYAPKNLSIPGRSKQYKGNGSWNKARIVSFRGTIEHWLNGEMIVRYKRSSGKFRKAVEETSYVNHPAFGSHASGNVGILGGSGTVRLRSIKIRPLNP